MKFRSLCWLLITTVFISPAFSASAQKLCGGFLEKGNTKAFLETKDKLVTKPEVTCSIRAKRKCILTFLSDRHKIRVGQFLPDRLTLVKDSAKDKWRIHLQANGHDMADLRRMSITIDKNDPLEISTEFLSHGKYNWPNRAAIDPRLTQLVADALSKGTSATVTVTYGKEHKTLTDSFPASQFKDAANAFKWVACMQAKK